MNEYFFDLKTISDFLHNIKVVGYFKLFWVTLIFLILYKTKNEYNNF